MTLFRISLALLMAVSVQTSVFADVVSTGAERKGLSITLYQNGLGFIHDQRVIDLKKGSQNVRVEDVPEGLITDSLDIHAPKAKVMSRKFDFKTLDQSVLLARSVGKMATFERTNPQTGKQEKVRGKILSEDGQLVEIDGKVYLGAPGRIILDKLPSDVRLKPTLSVGLISDANKKDASFSLSYLTNGFSWYTSYSARYNPKENQLYLSAWANITNGQNVAFPDATLRLASGDVKRISPTQVAPPVMQRAMVKSAAMMDVQAESAMPSLSSTGDFYLYHLSQPVDLKAQQTQQVALFNPVILDVKRTLVHQFPPVWGPMRGTVRSVNPQVELSFENSSEQPLPSGLVRLYQDDQNQSVFIGEDRLKQTPVGQDVTLIPGNNFDVQIKRSQINYKAIDKNAFEAAYEIEVNNASSQTHDVRIIANMAGDWEIEKASHSFSRQANNKIAFEIELKAKEKKTISYRVSVKRR